MPGTASLAANPADGLPRGGCRADLIVGADGRHSTVREGAGLALHDVGAPIDVLWFRLERDATAHPSRTGGILRPGAMLVMLNRGSYWQCAYVIAKGAAGRLQAEGFEAFRERVTRIAPFFAPELAGLASWADIKLLNLQRLPMLRRLTARLVGIGVRPERVRLR